MLRLRQLPPLATNNEGAIPSSNIAAANAIKGKKQLKARNPCAPPLPLVLLVLWCSFRSVWNFHVLMEKNFGQEDKQQPAVTLPPRLRAGNIDATTLMTNDNNQTAKCPNLPERLLHHHVDLLSLPVFPLTKDDVQSQMKLMIRNRLGTMGDIIMTCPDHHRSRVDPYGRIKTTYADTHTPQTSSPICRGIVKHYKHRSVYDHVKRILTTLEHTGIVPRLLYSDDSSLTLVEEDKGFLTMRNSPIPVDFDVQLRRILCILRKHAIVHRDLTYPNFIIDEVTGMIYIIDFGDAVMWDNTNHGWLQWDNFNWRNLHNLFMIWLRKYDEEERLEAFIADTIPEITGDRQWRPPTRQWTSLNQNKIGSLLLAKELVK
jgi:hypothetical protein